MAKAPAAPPALPGDVVQITDREHPFYRALMVVEDVRPRFTAARFAVQLTDRSHDSGLVLDWSYHRLRPGQYQVCGNLTRGVLDGEMAKARRLATETARLLAEEAAKS